jgi:segregation and condensation protein B
LDPIRIVEAVLFSTPRPLRVADIARETGLPQTTIRKSIKDLASEYDERKSAIEIAKIGPSFSMQLRDDMADAATPFAEKEVPEEALKTAAMVGYHQPILQSDLTRMLGSGVYDHVRALRSLGLIKARRVGHTLELTTTKRFSEYFGITNTDREGIKEWLESKIKD